MARVRLEAQINEQKRRVDFNTFDISVKELVSMVHDRLIDIAPVYQRQFRWEEERESKLIESIMLGIPIPNLFMATNSDGTWELIDGVQRISSILHFVAQDEEVLELIGMKEVLRIEGLEKLDEMNGLIFDDLPKNIQLSFLLNPLKVTTLSDKSDMDVRFDLFERLNTGGIKLSSQEIRSCIFRGRFNDLLKELSMDANFNAVVKVPKSKENDGTREELVLRFFAYLNNYKKFDHSVKEFLNDYMKTASKKFDYKKNEQLFRDIFRLLKDVFPKGISRGRNTTPVNLYEAVAVGAAMAYRSTGTLITQDASQWITSEELSRLTSDATNIKSKVEGRIEYCKAKFEGR